jgi:hypothetical protein
MQPWSITDLLQGSWLYAIGFLICAGLLIWAVWSGRDE